MTRHGIAGAVPLGYGVLVVADVCATRDLDRAHAVSHRALHRAALASIDDTSGAVMTTDGLLALPRAAA